MKNNDTLFEQIKNVAQNAETKEFDAMDKIWNNIEQKIDQKNLKKQKNTWKKIAVAASILLVGTISYSLLNTSKTEINSNKNKDILPAIVSNDTINKTAENATADNAEIETPKLKNPVFNTNSDQIIASKNNVITMVEDKESVVKFNAPTADYATEKASEIYEKEQEISADKKAELGTVFYDIRSKGAVQNNANVATQKEKEEQKPLLIADNKVVKDFDGLNIETIVELKEPLYIINGTHYSEEELYGKNPTSPYYPLSKQKITATTILSPEKAITIYGESGKNGVILLTTKNGKPRK